MPCARGWTIPKLWKRRKKADQNRKAKDRGQLKVPEARSVVESGDDGKDRESVRIGTGRPPLDPEFERHLGINFSAEKVAF